MDIFIRDWAIIWAFCIGCDCTKTTNVAFSGATPSNKQRMLISIGSLGFESLAKTRCVTEGHQERFEQN